jgi:hypothetical protein
VNGGLGLVVKHANERHFLWQRCQQFRETVGDANTSELVGVVCPHKLVIVNLAERTHPNMCLVVSYCAPDGTVAVSLSEASASAEKTLHRIIQGSEGGAIQIPLFNGL